MTAIGYIRQSRRADLDVALSHESQQSAIRRLAERDGIDPDAVTILEDMGRSGAAGKESRRPEYLRLVEAIEAGAVQTVYALSLTRLARSTVELYRLAGLAAAHGVRLVFAKEGTMDPTSPIGKAQFGTMAVFAEFERDLAVERANDNVAVRRSRGEVMGRRPYGDHPGENAETVLAAYREAGSYNGAAVKLNRGGIPTRFGRPWSATPVRMIVARNAPELMPRNPRRGAAGVGGFALYGLLRCSCGSTLTGFHGKSGRLVRYRCHRSDTIPDHPRPKSVAETAVLPWIKAEAARLRVPYRDLELDADTGVRASLEAQRRAVGDAFIIGAYTKVEAAAKVAELVAEMDKLDVRGRAVAIAQAVDWTKPPAIVNAVLRALWHHVQLGPDLRPVSAEWTVPEWRS